MQYDSQIIQFLKNNCPNIWSILNKKAKNAPPKGLQEFLSGELPEEREERKVLLQQADKRISRLIEKTSERMVSDTYRRDLSGAESENKLAEFFCEISLADSLSSISSEAPVLRPKNESGTECDVKVVIKEFDLFGDSKRLEDKWVGGKRSLVKSPPESKPKDANRPRAMDLYSKLKDTPRQFPNDTLNVIFLFHPSVWNTKIYIKQALFGDKSTFDDSDQPYLYEDGLYSLPAWQKISACVYFRLTEEGSLSVEDIWRNPNAVVNLQENMVQKLKDAG